MSRRDFLKLSLAGMAGLAGGELLNSQFFKIIEAIASQSIESKQGLARYFSLVRQFGDSRSQQNLSKEHPELQENPLYQSCVDMLQGAIAKYGGSVHYTFEEKADISPDLFTRIAFQEIRDWRISDAVRIVVGGAWPEQDGISLRVKLQRILSDEYQVSVLEQSAPLFSFQALLDTDSAIAARARNATTSSDENDSITALKQEIKEIIEMVASSSTQWSSSDLLAHFLQINDGDLALAIQDCYLFTKFLARNNLITGETSSFDGESGFEENMVVWRKLVDDCGVRGSHFSIPYADQNNSDINDPNKEVSVVNKIGVVYHRFGMLALLSKLHPTIVGLMGATNALAEIESQGGYKVSSDAMVASELPAVVDFLHNVNGPIRPFRGAMIGKSIRSIFSRAR